MSLKSDLNSVAKDIDKLIKNEIKKKKLVDTSTLLNSISSRVTINQKTGAMDIRVVAEDYYKYLDDEYKITDSALSGAKFTPIQKKLEEAYFKYLEEKINTEQIKD